MPRSFSVMLRLIPALVLLLILVSYLPAQTVNKRQAEVIARLKKLKPRNTALASYKIVVPPRPRELPADLRVDLVYEQGHHEYEDVVLRFDRRKGEPFVDITMFSHGSALGFWRPYSQYEKGDKYEARQGLIPTEDFDRLVETAVWYVDSDIVKMPKPFDIRNGIIQISASLTASSGEGHVVFRVSAPSDKGKTIVNGDGSLIRHIPTRKQNGYEYLRAVVFWDVFNGYLSKTAPFPLIGNREAEQLIIDRLSEPNLTGEHGDVYRQAALVNILGEVGTVNSLKILDRVIRHNGLPGSSSTYISNNANEAIRKILTRAR